RSLRADLGVMISASHNPYEDNGIKLFDPDGYKLSDEAEGQIETLMAAPADQLLVPADRIGRAKRIESAQERYIEYAKRTLPRNIRLNDLRVVVDCANGAGYQVALRRCGSWAPGSARTAASPTATTTTSRTAPPPPTCRSTRSAILGPTLAWPGE